MRTYDDTINYLVQTGFDQRDAGREATAKDYDLAVRTIQTVRAERNQLRRLLNRVYVLDGLDEELRREIAAVV